MDYENWKPLYEKITTDMGYDIERDIEGARLLNSLLTTPPTKAIEALSAEMAGMTVTVTGGALKGDEIIENGPVLATGSSVTVLLNMAIVPLAVVTDLDKDIKSQLDACSKGAVAVVHAHGDNMGLLNKHINSFKSPVLGTCQCKPFGKLVNFGGFTDGDRAVLLARKMGARKCVLAGFDFENANNTKKKKLKWARYILSLQGDFVEMMP
ncbi:MAG TPA: DUF115 domain-containing protein [Euryarchaeota archaeon]|nr:DUF115 domain-containing protein [Euryarchaeota archaeon]